MTDHGKCTTCGRDMHPASRYGGLCWECHDAEGERKDHRIDTLERTLGETANTLQEILPIGKVKHIGLLEVPAGVEALAREIRVLRAALKHALRTITIHGCNHSCVLTNSSYRKTAKDLAADLVQNESFSKVEADIIRRIFDE